MSNNKSRNTAPVRLATQTYKAPKKSRAHVTAGAGNKGAKFGSVVVRGSAPDKAVVLNNIKLASEALERVSKKLLKPGVAIRQKKNVPLYSIADGETGVFVRRLNGQTERGRLVNGIFQVLD